MKYSLMLLAVLAAVVVSSNADQEEDDAFEAFKRQYKKQYHPNEAGMRRSLFGRTHREIKLINSKGLGWKAGHNEFSDWTDVEKQALRGSRPPQDEDRSSSLYDEDHLRQYRQTPAATVDYRNHACMPAVKNQGRCGSCWAFAALTPMEFAQCMKSSPPTPTVLSEQQLVSCDIGWGDNGCGGGFYSNAWNFLKNVTGSVTSASYPYISGANPPTNGICQAFNNNSVAARVSGWGWYPANTAASTIMSRVNIGPVSVAVYVTNAFQLYTTGVFNDTTCTSGTFMDVNHAVVIVGYGTDLVGGDYWIVRNSWGASWGMGGYILMKRGVNQCWIESWIRYPNLV